MTKFEHEHRKGLEHTEKETRRQYLRREGQEGNEEARSAWDRASAALAEWDDHIVQLVPAPAGLTAVYQSTNQDEERGEHRGAIVMCGLQRSGEVTMLAFDPDGLFQAVDEMSNFVRFEFEADVRLSKP